MLKKLFGFDPEKTSVKTEIVAGITTFLTMSYILAVNPSMFGILEGMPAGAVFTSTALAAIVGCLAMAFIGKLPFGLAPGMGLNAFFVYSVCLGMGYPWQFALTAVLIEGVIFIILTLTNVREAFVNAIPEHLRNAIGAGIGLFIAFIGLHSGGIIVADGAHVKDLLATTGYIRGGCSPVGMKKKFPTYFDASAGELESLTVSAGVRGAQLLLNAKEIIEFTRATLVSVT